MKKITIIIMLLTVVSQILGFVRDITLSYFYGTTFFSDAYLIALTITNVFYSFVLVALSTSFIPIFREIEMKKKLNQSIIYTNNIINISLLLSIVISLLVFTFANDIVSIIGIGMDEETQKLAVVFTRIGIVNIYFTGLVYILSAFLQLRNRYIVPALIGIPFNLVVITSIYFSHEYFMYSIAIGIALSGFAQFIFLLPFAKKEGFNYKIKFDFKDENIKKTITMSIPIVIGASMNEINLVISKILATQQGIGAVSALNYADRLVGFIYGIFIGAIVTVVFPLLSRLVSEKNLKQIKSTLQDSLIGITIFVLPASMGLMVLDVEIVTLLFGRGAFDEQAIRITSGSLFYFSFGIVAVGYREVLLRVFYAYQDTKTPVINALIVIVINLLLSLTLSKFMGVYGLALATSISAGIAALLLSLSLKRKIGNFIDLTLLKTVGKIIFSACLMGLFVTSIKLLIISKYGIMNSIQIIICILVGVILYCMSIICMRIDYVNSFVMNMRNRGKAKK